jgi:hypothetical protein
MNFVEIAMQCRALSQILPEVEDELKALEVRVLKQAADLRQDQTSRPTLDQRRLKIALWPEIQSKLDISARRMETGLTIDVADLRDALKKFISAFDAAHGKGNSELNGVSWPHRLRQAIVLANVHEVAPIKVQPWMHKIGEHNPLTWSERRLHRVQRDISRSDRNSNRHLDEIVLADFMAKSLGNYGSLEKFLSYAADYVVSDWGWVCEGGAKSNYRKIIASNIEEINQAASGLLTILWDYPRIWRDLPGTNTAADAIVDAILACCEAIKLLSREAAVFPDDNLTFVTMTQSVQHAKDLSSQLCDEASDAFPGFVKFRTYARHDAFDIYSSISLGLRFGKVCLWKRPTSKEWILDVLGVRNRTAMYEPMFYKDIFDWYREGPQAV